MPDMKLPERDPTLVALAYKKQRLYLFTRREPADAEDASVSGLIRAALIALGAMS
jgi:hypothetical protein